MKNADFQYVGLSFSKEAYIANFQVPCENFQEKGVAVFTKFSSHKWHLAELVSSSSCTSNRSPFASRSRRHMSLTFRRPIFFRLQLRELPKTPVGVVRILPYNHGFLVENGSENEFWGIQFLGLQCSTLDVYDWETVRLIAFWHFGADP